MQTLVPLLLHEIGLLVAIYLLLCISLSPRLRCATLGAGPALSLSASQRPCRRRPRGGWLGALGEGVSTCSASRSHFRPLLVAEGPDSKRPFQKLLSALPPGRCVRMGACDGPGRTRASLPAPPAAAVLCVLRIKTEQPSPHWLLVG